jgi:hypothetical protein
VLMLDLVQIGVGARLEADHQTAMNLHGDDYMVPTDQNPRQVETAAAARPLQRQKIRERQRQMHVHLMKMPWNLPQCWPHVSQEHSNDHHYFCQWPQFC